MLHLTLGAQPIALVDPTPPPYARVADEDEARPIGEIGDLFPDLDRL